MLSLKTRIGAFVAAAAVAAALAIPAVAQALWCDDRAVHSDGEVVSMSAYANPSSAPQVVPVDYYSDGPSVSGPSTVVIPAGASSVDYTVTIGAGNPGETVWVGSSSSAIFYSTTFWVE
jgi:hypothetical protein